MFERKSKPRSGDETNREAVTRIVRDFGNLDYTDLDNLTNEEVTGLTRKASLAMANLQSLLATRILQSTKNQNRSR